MLKDKIVSLLRKSEKYTKTDMVYLAKGGFWLGLGQAVSMISVFATSVAFANLLPQETYGIYKYVLSIAALLAISTLSGMDSAVTQSTARGFDGTLSLGVKTKIKWGILGTLASLIVALYYYAQGNTEFTIAFCIVSIFMPFSESFDMYNSLLMGKKLFDIQTKYNIIRKVLSLIFMVGILFITKNIFAILSVYFLTLTVPAGLFLYRTVKKYVSNRDSDPEAMRYGKHLSAIYVIALVLGELDKVLVFHYLGAINLAIYSIAVAPTDQIKGLLKNVNSLAMPQFSTRTPEEIKRTIWHKISILALVTSSVIIIYIALTPLFFNLFFPKYIDAINYSQIISISVIPAAIIGLLYTILESQKSKKELYQYNFITNITNIIILFPLVYYLGIWGAVFARLIVRFFNLTILGWMVSKIKTDPQD